MHDLLCGNIVPCSVLDEFQVNYDPVSTVEGPALCPVYYPHQVVRDVDIIVSDFNNFRELYFFWDLQNFVTISVRNFFWSLYIPIFITCITS